MEGGPGTLRKQRPALTTAKGCFAMAILTLPDAEYLHKRLAYDPETGSLFWRPGESKRWNTKNAGKPALNCLCRYGYKVGRIDGRGYRSHRVIWKMMTGTDPDEIDHINGNRADNRWLNLRCVSRIGNCRNLALPTTNKSGVVGVSWRRDLKCWRVTISEKHIGHFATFDEAVIARKRAEDELNFHPNHGMR